MSISVLFLNIFVSLTNVIAIPTLTTGVKNQDDIVRPTPSSRKWNHMSELIVNMIEPQSLNNESMSLRKFDDSDVRLGDIWNWDYWCKLQPVVGTCEQNIRKYYFDLKTELCKQITYSGCSGGKNLFDTKSECERTCVGANDMLKPSLNFAEQLDCFYQPDPGRCLGYEEEYFYDVNLETCRTFVYGGCGGNPNRFNTASQCMRNCKNNKRRANQPPNVIRYDR